MLQCLSNSEELTEYFISDRYKADINKDNVLGHGGKIAVVYADLLRSMWSGKYSVCAPSDFKKTIGEFCPQFAGYQQQDSQEFMQFLLDGLHEDLNRVKKKPFVEAVESNNRPDDEVARESWDKYKMRNDSELVDKCYGQLRSHVTCANCRRESVTFDAFSCLSLPIPIRNTKPVHVLVFLLPLGCPHFEMTLNLEKTAVVADLKKALYDSIGYNTTGNRTNSF
jgi:ubiquitin carboxyl-terminal hydrolase 4/11/15